MLLANDRLAKTHLCYAISKNSDVCVKCRLSASLLQLLVVNRLCTFPTKLDFDMFSTIFRFNEKQLLDMAIVYVNLFDNLFEISRKIFRKREIFLLYLLMTRDRSSFHMKYLSRYN